MSRRDSVETEASLRWALVGCADCPAWWGRVANKDAPINNAMAPSATFTDLSKWFLPPLSNRVTRRLDALNAALTDLRQGDSALRRTAFWPNRFRSPKSARVETRRQCNF